MLLRGAVPVGVTPPSEKPDRDEPWPEIHTDSAVMPAWYVFVRQPTGSEGPKRSAPLQCTDGLHAF